VQPCQATLQTAYSSSADPDLARPTSMCSRTQIARSGTARTAMPTSQDWRQIGGFARGRLAPTITERDAAQCSQDGRRPSAESSGAHALDGRVALAQRTPCGMGGR
jgi:hypothetical protein